MSKREYAFYNILKAEANIEEPTEEERLSMIETSSAIFDMLEERTAIVEFFKKDDEVKKLRRDIKRLLLKFVKDPMVNKTVMERYIELARVNFGKR